MRAEAMEPVVGPQSMIKSFGISKNLRQPRSQQHVASNTRGKIYFIRSTNTIPPPLKDPSEDKAFLPIADEHDIAATPIFNVSASQGSATKRLS